MRQGSAAIAGAKALLVGILLSLMAADTASAEKTDLLNMAKAGANPPAAQGQVVSTGGEDECVSKCVHAPGRNAGACWEGICSKKCALDQASKGKDLLRLSSDGQTLFLTGPISIFNNSEIDHLLDTSEGVPEPLLSQNRKRSKDIKRLVLNSQGGDARVAQRIMDWVESRGPSLKVVVPDEAICASACAEIFRCAQNRTASGSAFLMYHPAHVEDDTGSERGARVRDRYNAQSENTSCARKAAETEGGREISEALRAGHESCYRAHELGGKGFLGIE